MRKCSGNSVIQKKNKPYLTSYPKRRRHPMTRPLTENPELEEPPDPPDEIMNPSMEACPLVQRPLLTLVYQSVFLSRSLAIRNPIR